MSQAKGSYRGAVGRGASVRGTSRGSPAASRGRARVQGDTQARGRGGRGGRQNFQQEAPRSFQQPEYPSRNYNQGESSQGSYVNRTKRSYKPRPAVSRRFFEVEIPRDSQFDLDLVRDAKVWFHEIPRDNGSIKKVLRMYCSDEIADLVAQNFSIVELEPPVADLEKGENMTTLVIPLSGILNSNGHIRRFMIEKAVDGALQSIQHRFQLIQLGDLEVRVSIRRPNEQHQNWSGKVFINILSDLSPTQIASLRELLSATEWQLDLNDTSGFRVKMKCYYSSTHQTEEEVVADDTPAEE